MRRAWALVAASVLVLSACAAGSTSGGDDTGGDDTGGASAIPSALDDPTAAGLPEPLIDVSQLRSGGPPPDGIPAIDEPRFDSAADIDWLADDESVLVLEVDGETRAYPVQVMIWHEIVNDVYGGRPIAVTYCPLCNSAIAFDRVVGGRTLSFGTSGLLLNSDLVMYDRETESLWPQLEFRAVAGALTGTELDPVALTTTAWADFRDAHPDALVLNRDTGFSRDYGRNPYVGYDEEDSQPFLFDGEPDPRLPPKAPVIGLFPDDDPVAVPTEALLDGPEQVRDVVVWVTGQAASALDRGAVANGRLVPTVAAFDAQGYTFGGADTIIDEETGSTWSAAGLAVAGPLAGTQLTPVPAVTTLWFAWAAFQPDTVVQGEIG
jgi:hypothetical protein